MRAVVLVPVVLSVLAGCAAPPGAGSDGGTTPDAGTALRISSMTPSSGPAAGGTAVTVTGSGFMEGVELYVGEAEATEVARLGENRLTAKTPPASLAGVALDVRVVSPGGAEAVLPAAFRYDAAPGITEAVLTTQLPPVLESLEDSATVALTAEVKAPGRTDGNGAPAGVRAQFGVGPGGAAPSGFTWKEGTFSADGNGERDLFSGSVEALVPPGEGTAFSFAARFSLDDGVTWTLAAPVLTATVRRPPVQWCKLGGVGTGPAALSVLAGSSGAEAYVQLYHPALTEAPGAAPGLEVEFGFGSLEEPAASAWTTWAAGSFNVQHGNDDEWKGALVPPAVPGTYGYAARARLRGGPWRLCDGDGSDDGFEAAQAGQFVVTAPAAFSCALQPLASTSLPGGAALPATVTTTGTGLRVQVGLGAAGSDPALSSLWGWSEAAQGGAGSWSATLHPAYTGDRAVAARASDDNGQSWTACNGAQPLTVTGVAAAGYCNLQYPPTVTVATATSTVVYGRVYQAGLTEAGGAPAGVTAELGYGKSTEDPGAAWSWTSGSWNVQVGNDDEFQAQLPAGAAVAGTRYAWRFAVSGGYCYGDLDGNTPGGAFSGEGAGGQPNLGTVLP